MFGASVVNKIEQAPDHFEKNRQTFWCRQYRVHIAWSLRGANRGCANTIIGLRRIKVQNKEILVLNEAYKEIFKSTNLSENLSKLNGKFKDNILVKEVVEFINKDKKRPICTPHSN